MFNIIRNKVQIPKEVTRKEIKTITALPQLGVNLVPSGSITTYSSDKYLVTESGKYITIKAE